MVRAPDAMSGLIERVVHVLTTSGHPRFFTIRSHQHVKGNVLQMSHSRVASFSTEFSQNAFTEDACSTVILRLLKRTRNDSMT